MPQLWPQSRKLNRRISAVRVFVKSVHPVLPTIRIGALSVPDDDRCIWLPVRYAVADKLNLARVWLAVRAPASLAPADLNVHDIPVWCFAAQWPPSFLWLIHSLTSVFLLIFRFRRRSAPSAISGTLHPRMLPKTKHPTIVSNQWLSLPGLSRHSMTVRPRPSV